MAASSIFSRNAHATQARFAVLLNHGWFRNFHHHVREWILLALTVRLTVDQDVVDTRGRPGIDRHEYGGLSPSSSCFLPSPSLQSCTLETSVVRRSLCLWLAFCLSVLHEVLSSCHCSPTWTLVQHVDIPSSNPIKYVHRSRDG